MDDINDKLRNLGGISPDNNGSSGNAGGTGGGNPVTDGSATESGERNAQPNAVGTESGASDGVRIVDPNGDSAGNSSGNPTGDAPYGYNKDGSPAAKRGRKPGSGNSGPRTANAPSGRTKSAAKSSDGLERLLYSIHAMAAVKIAPELMIDKAESQMLASAITAVQDHYGFDVGPEATLWINLVTALGTVYGPRVVTIMSRRKKERKEKGQPQQRQTETQKPQPEAWKPVIIPGMH